MGLAVLRRIIGPTICCCVLLVAAVGLAAVDAAGEILLVELISQERPEFQVTGTARLTYQASSDQWLPVRDLVLTPERTWSVAMEPGTGKLLLTTKRGDRITSGRPIRVVPDGPEMTIRIFGREYKGQLELRPSPNGVRIYNAVGLEDYTLGVLAGESYASWHPEALKAQAVVIRSYTLSHRRRHADGDFCDQAHCQRYFGAIGEQVFQRAVVETRGQILTYQGRCIKALYHASSGGRTENNEDVWLGDPIPYLRAVEDFDQNCPKYLWCTPTVYSVPEFLDKLGFAGWKECDITPVPSEKTGNIVAYRFQKPGSSDGESLTRETIRWRLGLFSPRFQMVRLKGSDYNRVVNGLNKEKLQIGQVSPENGQIRLTFRLETALSGQEIRTPLRLSATDVICISGKGSGHGVGLSQWGSQGMALRGMNYQTILRHYFGQEVVIADYTLNQEIR